MEITRDVVLDLLPLYMADEVSADTRQLVDAYLETDPQLAHIAAQSNAVRMPEAAPVPPAEAGRAQSYRRAKRLWLLGSVVLAVAFTAAMGLAAMAFFVFSQPVIVP